VALRLYDSAFRQVRDFVPLVPGQVGIYVCGPTPQSAPHVGHVRAAVSFDVLRRWLLATGHQVTYVRNVTDIDDKTLAKSAEAGREWWAHAFQYEREFDAAYADLNVLAPTIQPRATGHIIEMIELVERLIERGHAYVAPDGSGVYFDVRSYAQYGELTHQRLDDMEPAADADPGSLKHDPRDFALWKGRKPHEPETASWRTPWGLGRPGWHLECSAMATRYLGPEFDIHGGGIDLRFPHHENEQAQSRAAGDPFARYWLHNAWVVQAGEKMSKSVGNTMTIGSLFTRVRPAVLRYLLVAPHYRSHIEISDESLAEATAAYERIEGFVTRACERLGGGAAAPSGAVPAAFSAALDDDLGTPAAVAVLHDTVREGNRALADGALGALPDLLDQVRSMADVLGLDPLDPAWSGGAGDGPATSALETLVRAELDARAKARKERDFATSDSIRDRLAAAGIAIEDTPEGARWSYLAGRAPATSSAPAQPSPSVPTTTEAQHGR
jgi:cysteinyl-tRNA synthetase